MQALRAQQKLSELASWRHVSQTYWKYWAAHHKPLGLLPMPGGSVAVVRGGHMLTLLRKADATQKLQHQNAIGSSDIQPVSRDLQRLQECLSLMQGLLGPDVLSLFATLTTMTSSRQLSLQSISSALIEVLTSGPQMDSDQKLLDHTARQALLAWRRQRSAAILQLGQTISSMTSGTLVAALRTHLDLLQSQHTDAQSAPGDTNTASYIPGEALTVILRQEATQQLQASTYLLLIAWLNSLGAAGMLSVTPAVSHVLQQEIVPQLQTHICRTAISQWLCTAPPAVSSTEEPDISQSPQLHQQLASLAFASSTAAQDVGQHQCIAQLLLRDFASLLDGEHQLRQLLQSMLPACVCYAVTYISASLGLSLAVEMTSNLPLQLSSCAYD